MYIYYIYMTYICMYICIYMIYGARLGKVFLVDPPNLNVKMLWLG